MAGESSYMSELPTELPGYAIHDETVDETMIMD
jgi:hypothetical protein